MKLGTVESLKFKKLKMKLGLAQWQAIGLLESLWMFTARNAPLGDIGKHSNEDIAVHLEWDGDPDALIDVLVQCRWLDVDDEHRLLIHDWADHLPLWLNANLKRHDKKPITQSTKESTKQPTRQPPKQPAQAPSPADPTIFSSDISSSDLSSPDLPFDPTFGGTWLPGPSKEFEDWWNTYPVRTGKNDAWEAWQAAIMAIQAARGWTEEKSKSWLLQRTGDYRDSPAGGVPVGGSDFRPAPAKWLKSGRYDDDPVAWMKSNGDSKRISVGAGQVTAGDDNRF